MKASNPAGDLRTIETVYETKIFLQTNLRKSLAQQRIHRFNDNQIHTAIHSKYVNIETTFFPLLA